MSVILERPWRAEYVLQLIAGLMFCLAATGLIGMLAHQFIPSAQLKDPFLRDFLLGTILFHGSSLVLIHLFMRRHGLAWGEFLGWNHPRRRRAIILGLLAGVGVLVPALGFKLLSSWLLTASNVEFGEIG